MSPSPRSEDHYKPTDPKGWYSRGYLPHLDKPMVPQSITFRLADALPKHAIEEINSQVKQVPKDQRSSEHRRRLEQWMDAGLGCCALAHPAMARVMVDALRAFDGERYRLLNWCVMPNHVHVLIVPWRTLYRIVQSWKSFTGRWAIAHNEELKLNIPGPKFWMHDYWDRYIRDHDHLCRAIDYIHNNPVRAGLCATPKDWPWSSAHDSETERTAKLCSR